MESPAEDISMATEADTTVQTLEHHNEQRDPTPNEQGEYYQNIASGESARAKVLRNFELLDLIMSFMVDASSSLAPHLPLSQPDSIDLLWAALTCRVFFDPAMNSLWKRMDSWPAILHLIPTLTKDDNAVAGVYTTSEVILGTHLERLSSYTRRIRHFSLSPFTESVSPHIYASLLHFHDFKLFPALLTLDVTNFAEICLSGMLPLSLFFPPTLTSIAIRLIQPSNVEVIAASILHMVASHCRNVRSVVLNGHITDMCLNTLLNINILEQLEINTEETDMSISFMQKLSMNQHLKSLHVSMTKPIHLDNPGHDPKSIKFPSLETLQMHGPSNAIYYILRNMSLGKISSLSLDFASTPEGGATFAERCMSALEAMGVYQSLQSIGISSDTNSVIRREVMMKHLGEYGAQLESISVETNSSLHNNLEILCRQRYSTNLKHLKYVTQRASGLGMPTHPSKLFVIKNRLLNIETLQIPVALDMSKEEIEKMQTRMKGERRCHGLQEVVLRPLGSEDPAYELLQNNPDTLTVSNALVVGNYLNYLFPHLKAVDLSRFSELDEDWREAVESVVMELQRERRRLDGRDLCCKACTRWQQN